MNLPEIEQKILKFWQKKRIFEKSLKQRKNAERFVFFEGPGGILLRRALSKILVLVTELCAVFWLSGKPAGTRTACPLKLKLKKN
jgi:hypothetical protein